LSIIDDLIFDRTDEDLVRGNPKGKYDYIDYNRVGEATNYVATEIGGLNITAKTDWVRGNIPRDSQMTKYRTDVQKIVTRLAMDNELPINNHDIATIQGANQLEKALYDAYNLAIQLLRWHEVDEINETWEQLDEKAILWSERFIKIIP
jgi:hypothetical protein